MSSPKEKIPKSTNTKTQKITFRINDEAYEKLQLMLHLRPKAKKSKILREALDLWLLREFNNQGNPDGKLVLTNQNIFRLLFEYVDYLGIQKLLKLATKNHELGLIKSLSENQERPIPLLEFHNNTISEKLEMLRDNVYGENAFGWLDKFKFNHNSRENKLRIEIRHQLGRKFGVYIAALLENHVKEFDYILVKEDTKFDGILNLNSHILHFAKKSFENEEKGDH